MDPAHSHTELVLTWMRQRFALDESGSLVLGAADGSDVVVERPFVSRRHAVLCCKDRYFELTDVSTNGTFVQTEDEQVHFVHRGSLRLWGQGWISLGEPLCEEAALRFEHPAAERLRQAAGR